jgi:hypothetical protein
MNRLLAIGFMPVGFWRLNENSQIRYTLNSNQNARNILYAFVSNGDIKYIGKTTRTLNSRMYGYQNPGPTQNTNIRVNALLRQYIEANLPVDIIIHTDNGLLSYGGFKINIAAGLEDTLIYETNPEWNYSGKNKLKEDKESEDIRETKDPIPEIETEITTIGSFSVVLGQTYFNQGFFNVPIDYSDKFADNNSKIEILLGDTTNSIQGYINRQANKNETPRIMGGIGLKNWIQSYFKQNDRLKVRILSPTSIELQKE